jgi:hypothetical protein
VLEKVRNDLNPRRRKAICQVHCFKTKIVQGQFPFLLQLIWKNNLTHTHTLLLELSIGIGIGVVVLEKMI